MNIPAPFTQNQVDYLHRSAVSWFNVAEGGKRGGKNVLQTLAFCIRLEVHPDKLHLVAGVSQTTAKLNILDCDGYGLLNFFEGRCREGKYKDRACVYVQTKMGEKIVLVSGGGKAGDEKYIKGNTYGMAYITEANECHESFVREVFDRTISSSDRKIFHDLNPKAPGHWYYAEILDFHQKKQDASAEYGYNYGHFTIADNMSVSDDKLRKVLSTYQKGTVWYDRDILGLRKVAEGLVYPMFGEHCIVEAVPRPYTRYLASMDYGIQNPTSIGIWGLLGGTWYRVKEYYHSGRKTGQQKTDQQYYEAFEALAGELPVEKLIIDPSATSFIALVEQKKRFKVWRANNNVLEGIQHVAACLQDGTIKINSCCRNAVQEFGLYRWDETSDEDKPVKDNDHAMDDIRYFVNTTQIWRKKTPYHSIF